jgi:hypothetical protein
MSVVSMRRARSTDTRASHHLAAEWLTERYPSLCCLTRLASCRTASRAPYSHTRMSRAYARSRSSEQTSPGDTRLGPFASLGIPYGLESGQRRGAELRQELERPVHERWMALQYYTSRCCAIMLEKLNHERMLRR